MSKLTEWLRQNSSGDYRKCYEAAYRIEHLERVLVQAREALKDSDVRVYELCSTFSTPEPEATRKRTADAIAAIDEAMKIPIAQTPRSAQQ